MFNNFFKKTRPKQFMLEQTGTRVLLLPAKFANHTGSNQKFSTEEQKELAALFKRNKVTYYTYNESFLNLYVRLSVLGKYSMLMQMT